MVLISDIPSTLYYILPLFSIFPRWGSLSLSRKPLMLTKLLPYFFNIPEHILGSLPPSFMIETLDLSTIFWKINGNFLAICLFIHKFSTLKWHISSCDHFPMISSNADTSWKSLRKHLTWNIHICSSINLFDLFSTPLEIYMS